MDSMPCAKTPGYPAFRANSSSVCMGFGSPEAAAYRFKSSRVIGPFTSGSSSVPTVTVRGSSAVIRCASR